MKQFIGSLCGLILLASISSCKKTSGGTRVTPPVSTDCRIKEVFATNSAISQSSTVTYTYDDQGNISGETSTGSTNFSRTFTRSGNKLLIQYLSGKENGYDSLSFNAHGYVTRTVDYPGVDHGLIYVTEFQYNGNDELISEQLYRNGVEQSSYKYTYTNGDPTDTYDVWNDTHATTTYDLTKSAQEGDLPSLQERGIFHGLHSYKHTHLPVSGSGGLAGPIPITYTFDEAGKIITVSANLGSEQTANITYECF